MSNTDGEDTQRIEGLNPGDKAYILTEEQYIKFEKQNDVIADLKFKLKNDAIFQEYSDLEKELASLREQLKEKDERCNFKCDGSKSELEQFCGCYNQWHQELMEQLKQKEEVIRELIPIAEKCLRTFQYDNLKIKDFVNGIPSDQSDAIKAIIEKAKSLTTKDKCSED